MGISKAKERLGETFITPSGGIITIIGISENKVGRSRKHLVSCSICSEDKELFPKPFEILYNHLKNGRVPCRCSAQPKSYTKDQIETLIKRKCEQLGHTFLGWEGEFLSATKTKPIISCPHKDNINQTCDNYLNTVKYGCKSCETDHKYSEILQKGNYPSNVTETRVTRVECKEPLYEYRCDTCSLDWYVINGYCNGWFDFRPSRLRKNKLSCRCNSKYYGDDKFKLGRARYSQRHNTNIKINKISNGRVYYTCVYHGEGTQDYSCCCEGRLPKCCNVSSWRTRKGQEDRIDYLYVMRLVAEDEIGIKIGRSFNIRNRQDEIDQHYQTELLYFIQDLHQNVVKYEEFFHRIFSKYSITLNIDFAGQSEIFSEYILLDPDFQLLMCDTI